MRDQRVERVVALARFPAHDHLAALIRGVILDGVGHGLGMAPFTVTAFCALGVDVALHAAATLVGPGDDGVARAVLE